LGGQVQVVFGIAGIVAELDERGARRIASVKGIRAVHSEAVDVSGDVQTQAAIAAWNQMSRPRARRPVADRSRIGRRQGSGRLPEDPIPLKEACHAQEAHSFGARPGGGRCDQRHHARFRVELPAAPDSGPLRYLHDLLL